MYTTLHLLLCAHNTVKQGLTRSSHGSPEGDDSSSSSAATLPANTAGSSSSAAISASNSERARRLSQPQAIQVQQQQQQLSQSGRGVRSSITSGGSGTAVPPSGKVRATLLHNKLQSTAQMYTCTVSSVH
jgi:hypothetical protein